MNSPTDMCECPEMLVNEWLDSGGQVVESRELSELSDPDADGADFLAHPTAVGWRIVCPTCRRLYAEFADGLAVAFVRP